MKPCPDHKETLWLDVYGELNPNERPAWKKHLETCGGCRQERAQLLRLLQTVKVSMPSPTLSREKAETLISSITRKLGGKREETWGRRRLWGMPHRFIPALAAASILIVALGWFSMKGFRNPSSVRSMAGLKSEKQVFVKDVDIIKNLELLEEMDTLQKLVQAVDHGDVPSYTNHN
ncbi:MAG: anti-sigma factor family protein [Thermodesulfobacteriota bacterium]